MASAQELLKDPITIAMNLNKQREICNASMTLEDGISDRRNSMTTLLMYKNFLLSDCRNAATKQMKLTCIEGNVPLKVGRVNYISYRGKRNQIN